MRVSCGSCTFKTLAASRTLAGGESFADIEEMQKREAAPYAAAASQFIELVFAGTVPVHQVPVKLLKRMPYHACN
jgi:hypothetical protein